MTSANQPTSKNPGTVDFRRRMNCALGAGRHIHDRHDDMELRHQKPAARQAASKSDAAGSIRFRFPNPVHEKFWNTKLQHLHCGSFRHRRHDIFSPAVSGDYETVSVCKNQTTCRAPLHNRSMDFLTGILIRGFVGCTAISSTSHPILACAVVDAGDCRSGRSPDASRPTGTLSLSTTTRSIPTSTIDSVPSQAVGRRQCFAAFPVSRGETPGHHSIAMTMSEISNPALVPNVIAKSQSVAFR